MTRRVSGGSWPELRAARVAFLRRFQDGAPGIFADQIATLEAGAAVVMDTEQMFSAVHQINPDHASREYAYRTDPDNRRRFLLDGDDRLTEITEGTA